MLSKYKNDSRFIHSLSLRSYEFNLIFNGIIPSNILRYMELIRVNLYFPKAYNSYTGNIKENDINNNLQQEEQLSLMSLFNDNGGLVVRHEWFKLLDKKSEYTYTRLKCICIPIKVGNTSIIILHEFYHEHDINLKNLLFRAGCTLVRINQLIALKTLPIPDDIRTHINQIHDNHLYDNYIQSYREKYHISEDLDDIKQNKTLLIQKEVFIHAHLTDMLGHLNHSNYIDLFTSVLWNIYEKDTLQIIINELSIEYKQELLCGDSCVIKIYQKKKSNEIFDAYFYKDNIIHNKIRIYGQIITQQNSNSSKL